MNLMTSSPERDTVSATIKIIAVNEFGGFASADIGGKVYISRSAAKRLKLQPGDTFPADLVPNTVHPESTPWFALYIRHPEVHLDGVTAEDVLHHLRDAGDAWTARQVAEVFLTHVPSEQDVAEMHRILDGLYLRNCGVAKVMMFTQAAPGGPLATWFTAVPERVDVGEFED